VDGALPFPSAMEENFTFPYLLITTFPLLFFNFPPSIVAMLFTALLSVTLVATLAC